MASASQWRNGRDAGKGKAKGKAGKGGGEDWQWAMMCEMMAFMAKGKGKGKPGQPGSKKNKGKPKEPKEGKEQQLPKDALSDADLETLKDQVLQFLEEKGGHYQLSDLASSILGVKLSHLKRAGFVFGPPNEAGDIFVYPPDTDESEGLPQPEERAPRKTELEVLPEILEFMDESGGHAALKDLHKKFKLKEKPKKRLEVLGFTFADNETFGGCEVFMPKEAAPGGKRKAWIGETRENAKRAATAAALAKAQES